MMEALLKWGFALALSAFALLAPVHVLLGAVGFLIAAAFLVARKRGDKLTSKALSAEEVPMATDSVKMTVNVTQEVADSVRELANKQGTTITNVVNKSIVLERFLYEETLKGGRIQIQGKDGKVREVLLRCRLPD